MFPANAMLGAAIVGDALIKAVPECIGLIWAEGVGMTVALNGWVLGFPAV